MVVVVLGAVWLLEVVGGSGSSVDGGCGNGGGGCVVVGDGGTSE